MKTPKSVRECAFSFLEYADRTEKELRQKLKDREYDPQEIEKTLELLKEYHYIDDAAYAGKYIRVYSAKKSTRQIVCDLQRKGIARDVIENWLEEMPVDEETQICAYIRKKGYQPGQRLDADAYRKVSAALCRKGFSYEAVRRGLDRMYEEEF